MVLDKLTRALEQTADSVLITTRSGIIEYVNPAFEQMTGFSSDDLVGRTPGVLRSGVQKPHFYETLWGTILSGRPFHAVVTNRRRDGRLFDYDQTITPIRNALGVVTHFVSTGRDVTERRRAQAARIRHHVAHESRRLAGALHADAGQYLALAHMTLAEIARDADAGTAQRLSDVRQYLDRVEQRLRRAARGMRPRVVSELGLDEAIRLLADSWFRRTGTRVFVETSLNASCPAPVETLLYRFIHDALARLSERAHTTTATIVLTRQISGRRANDETIVCAVRGETTAADLGTMAEAAAAAPDVEAMHKRLAVAGGALEIVAEAGGMLELRATVPLGA